MTPAATIIEEREATHGAFADSARIAYRLTSVITEEAERCKSDPGGHDAVISMALTAIAVKIGRALAGDPTHLDHWVDIAGYAELVAAEIRRGQS